MSDLRKAAQQALEALEYAEANHGGDDCYADSITALRAALAQQPEPAQEPVAWALHTGTRQGIKWNRKVEHGTSLYTTPPQRPPLTDEEMLGIIDDAFEGASLLDVARAIERKVRGE